MKKSKLTKKALLSCILVILMSITMLIGTTFAWFTDTASTSVNKIQAGNLDVSLEMKNPDYNSSDNESKEWIDAEGKTLKWVQSTDVEGTTTYVDSTDILWEPGCTYELQPIRITNNGNLALKYKISISGIKGDAKLNEAIEWTIKVDDQTYDINEEHSLAANDSDTLTIKGHMKESAGNEYQDLSIDGIAITVTATQDTVENDSEGNDYDKYATYPVYATATKKVSVKDDNGSKLVASAVTLSTTEKAGDSKSDTPIATASVPVDTKLEENATSLTLIVKEDKTPSNIKINSDNKTAKTLEVSMNGLSSDNDIIIKVQLFIGKGLMNLELYHNDVKMNEDTTSADSVSQHNHYFYDSETGVVTMAVKNFSPFTAVYIDSDAWDGTSKDISWYNDTDTSFTISSAKELAGLAKLVNEGKNFANKTIYLSRNINLNGKEWTPIGNVKEKGFKGTFDGMNNKIYNLSINGSSKIGFFGFVESGSIKNLSFENANVSTSGYTAGILAAELRGVTIDNIKTSGNVKSLFYTGGVVGSLVGSSITADTKILNCENNATVLTTETGSSASYTGGIVGYASTRYGDTLIENCTNNGCIEQKGTYGPSVGGIAGFLTSEDNNESCKTVTIKNCENTGSVKGLTNVGGIAGAVGWPSGTGHKLTSLTATFINCSNTGTLSGTNTAYICETKINVCGGDANIHVIDIK